MAKKKRIGQWSAASRGKKIKRYYDPLIVKDPAMRKLAEEQQAKIDGQKETPITVRLVLHDGTVKEWELDSIIY